MVNPILSTENLKDYILSLGIDPEQEKFLLTELPTLDETERLGLLTTLKDVHLLNKEKEEAIESMSENRE